MDVNSRIFRSLAAAGIAFCAVTIWYENAPAKPAAPAKVSAYEQCLTQLIAKTSMAYAVDHAGSTICDRRARKAR